MRNIFYAFYTMVRPQKPRSLLVSEWLALEAPLKKSIDDVVASSQYNEGLCVLMERNLDTLLKWVDAVYPTDAPFFQAEAKKWSHRTLEAMVDATRLGP